MSSLAQQIAAVEPLDDRPGVADVLATLRWLDANAAWIRIAAAQLSKEAKRRADTALLMQEPAVSSLLAAFPGAAVTIREIPWLSPSEADDVGESP